MASPQPKISFIGFGEAAQAFTLGLKQDNSALSITAFDIKTEGPEQQSKRAEYDRCGVGGAVSLFEACRDGELIVSLVTADQAEVAANAVAQIGLNNALYLDCNSCAPDTKRRSAVVINRAGGRYVDVAIMTPVHPHLHKSPCLLAGPDAGDALAAMNGLGMVGEIAGQDVGEASMRKMVRSVMIKGLEAVTLECFLAARKAGIETQLLASLEASFPGFDWQHRAPYMIERAMTHGIRRAAEMREVVKTMEDLGIAPHMSAATAQRQHEVGNLGLDAASVVAKDPGVTDLGALTDAILAAQSTQASKRTGR